ncbi:MAG TPA: lysoplasmalogenase [Candidatus Dormibacteraeota bacterium]|nr:lysoplasmalogenase [Candidatus Dormibacteraeota bacterium]
MTTAAWVVLAAAVVIAVADWVSVARNIHWLEYATKPGFILALIALAVVMHPINVTERALFVCALAFGLVSDVLLMVPQDLFLFGLAAALVEHLAYIAGFRTRDLHAGYLVAALAIALATVVVILPPIYRALKRDHPQLVVPVIAYVAVFVVMVTSAGGTGSLVALAGALLFFYSDAILAWNRFVKPLPLGRVVNIVPYHVGGALLVLSLVS